MKKLIFCFLISLPVLQSMAQSDSDLYGIVRKNYYTLVTDPVDSTFIYQQFDSATVRLGYMDPNIGFVSNSGTVAFNDGVNLTGAALNPYTNTYIFMGFNNMNTLDLSNGELTNAVPIFNPIAESYFDNFRFNNSDSTLYGLARRNVYDPVTMLTTGEVFLATAEPQTGLITEISSESVGVGFALAGSAIDPYEMVFYYSTGSNLMGLDLYDGSIYSNPAMDIPGGGMFDNFTYSCADTALYGLIRNNYFSYEWDPDLGFEWQVLDSATMRLGRIDPNSGVVTAISPQSIGQGGYSLNAGSAIDPNSMTFYFSNGISIIGISMITGQVTSEVPFAFEDGQYFDMMRNFENCISAVPKRANPATVLSTTRMGQMDVELYPNPATNGLNVACPFTIEEYSLITFDGKLVYNQRPGSTKFDLNLEYLSKGIYILKLVGPQGQQVSKRVVKM